MNKLLVWIVSNVDAQNKRFLMNKEELKHYRSQILELAQRYHAPNVRVFGSTVREDHTPESDVDFLIDVSPKQTLLDLIILKAIEKIEVHIQSGKQKFFELKVFWYLLGTLLIEAMTILPSIWLY